jgi:hypothetical protein
VVGMVDAAMRARIDSALALLRDSTPKPPESAESQIWDVWMDLDELDSAIAGVLIAQREAAGANSISRSALAGWRRALQEDQRWGDLWPARKKALLTACEILSEAATGRAHR